jgi:hypothetical protein
MTMDMRFDEASEASDNPFESDLGEGDPYGEAAGDPWGEAVQPPRRYQPTRTPPPVRPPGQAVIQTPAGRAQMQIPGIAELTNRVNENTRGLEAARTGLGQLRRDQADLLKMEKRTREVTDRRFKRAAVATAIAAVTPLVITFVASHFQARP